MKEKINYGKAPFNGWSKWNPNKAKCDCGSLNVEFLWRNGQVVGFHCFDCGETELDKG